MAKARATLSIGVGLELPEEAVTETFAILGTRSGENQHGAGTQRGTARSGATCVDPGSDRCVVGPFMRRLTARATATQW